MGTSEKNIVAASLNPKNNNSKTQKDHQLKMFNFLRTYVIFFFVSYMSNAAWTCSVFCEDGKIPCGGYGSTCEGFRGCTYPDECNDNGDQFGQSNSFSSGPSFNPRPTYPSGGNSLNWERPSDQGSVWNQGGYNWQAPVYPNYQQPFNNNAQSYGSNNNGIVA